MQLRQGDLAPDIATNDVFGTPINLSAFRGKRVLLAFHRFSACPFCNLRVHQLQALWPEYDARGLEVITVFESSAANLREGVGQQNVAFPIVSNSDLSLYRAYGADRTSLVGMLRTVPQIMTSQKESEKLGLLRPIAREGKITRLPADFLIAPDGRIHTAHYGAHMADHLPFSAVDAFLPAIR